TSRLWTTQDAKDAVSAGLDVMGWQLPGYQVLELVGFGGSGEVWWARVDGSGEVVALERLHASAAGGRERLRREAATLRSLAPEVTVTASYVAPEVLTGAPASPASDIYSLCRVASTALSRTTSPEALVAAVEAGLAEDPHDRPDARRLATDVLRACAAAPVRL